MAVLSVPIVGPGEAGKALMFGASQTKGGENMSRIITASELQNRSLTELQALYRTVQQELAASAPGSAARRNALASLENISRAIAQRRVYPAPRF